MMQFIFFDAADNRLFVRDDAETATWSVKGMQLTAEFPFVKEKEIARGMRVGFLDDDGIFQPFEVRKVKTYEPDHYQELTAEHIAIAELTDEFYQGSDATDETASAALGTILTGTIWQVGNVTASNLSSADLDKGTVWQNIRNIEANWNVWITPRVTFSGTGITGRYLDIAPAEGVWRGVTLSVNGNADEMGVTVDDSETYTAAYGMGGAVGDDSEPLDFSAAVWTETAEHPAKPDGQKYVEDPAAKALYGRNGRNRFTYYQNADIKEAELLLQKTWDYLQTVNKPKVTIECIVRDLKRMGYAGEGIRRHDLVQVRIEPVGQIVVLTVDDLEVDLLDPTATRPTIGRYIPNIVYINRETMKYASGGSGGGQTETQYEKHVFEQEIYRTERSLELEAYERQLVDGELSDELTEASAKISISAGNISSICAGVGATLDAQGHVVVDPTTGLPVFNTDNPANMYSQIKQTESGISTLVSGVSAGVFNDHTAYAKDTYVMHNNKLYRFTAAHASGPWTGVDVVEVTGLFSRIDQESDRISLVVTGTGANAQVNRAGIVLAINGGTGHSTAVIEADQIDINGIVTALAAKDISVLDLSAEAINADSIDVGAGGFTVDNQGSINGGDATLTDVTCDNLTVGSEDINVADVQPNGNTLTITYVDGTTATFNKAVSLSGAWNGSGTYTVSATSGSISGTVPSTTANIQLTGNGSTSFSAELLSDQGVVQSGKSKNGYLHQSGNSVGVYTTYSGGSYSGLIASIPVSGGGGTITGMYATPVTGSYYDQTEGYWFGDTTIHYELSGDSTDHTEALAINVQEPINKGVNAGWTQAAQRTVWPTAGSGSSFAVTVADSTWGTTTGKTFSLNASNGTIYVNDGTNNVAQIAVGGSYSFSCTEQAARWTDSISGYLNCGTISKSSVQSNAYLRFRIKCDNAYKYCYITVNP